MWPWEHLAFGYVFYSLARRGLDGRGPSDREAIVLAFATQLPDLVDKPLAWELGLLPNGVSLAHSILVAVPVTAAVVVAARRREAGPIGTALGVGWFSHIAGDGLYPLLTGGGVSPAYMLWPLVSAGSGTDSFAVKVPQLWERFATFLATPRGQLYLAAELAFLAFALGLWLWDGAPGVPRPGERSA